MKIVGERRKSFTSIIVFSAYLSERGTDQLTAFKNAPEDSAVYYFRKFEQDFIKYYNDHPEKLDNRLKNTFDKVIGSFSDATGLNREETISEIIKGRMVHVVGFNPMETTKDLDWTLNDFLHEINFHLKKDIEGVVRNEKLEDHKQAYQYELLIPEQKSKLDIGQSIDPRIAPPTSTAFQLQQTIDNRIQTQNYKKDVSDEKQKEKFNTIRSLKPNDQ